MKRLKALQKGFALVEVVLALGIAAFVLTGIVALCSVALSSSKDSTDDTLLSEMAAGIMGELRATEFVDLFPKPGQAPEVPEEVDQPDAFDLPLRYYDSSGVHLDGAETAVYQCTITLRGDPGTLGVPRESSTDPSGARTKDINLLLVTLTFEWPAQATTPNTRVFHGTVARY